MYLIRYIKIKLFVNFLKTQIVQKKFIKTSCASQTKVYVDLNFFIIKINYLKNILCLLSKNKKPDTIHLFSIS